MFERFCSEYVSRRDAASAGTPWLDGRLVAVAGYAEFAGEFAGASFDGGLYRVHDEVSGPLACSWISDAFPEFTDRALPFGYDWLGRQLALDLVRIVDGEPLVLLLEPGTGEALEVPVTFAAFHDDELVDYADAALATQFFEAWCGSNADSVPLSRESCVGYRVPLFLGGQDVVENLEVSDLAVYWSICGQLRRGVVDLPPGTSINEVAGP